MARSPREARPGRTRTWWHPLWTRLLAWALGDAYRVRDEVQVGVMLREHEPGVWSVEGGFFACWVLETDRLAGLAEILTLFSRIFLQDTRRIIDLWKKSGHEDVLYFVLQQIRQFQRMGNRFAMRHKNTEQMTQTLEELKAAVIAELPPEEIIQGLTENQKRQVFDLLRQQLNRGE